MRKDALLRYKKEVESSRVGWGWSAASQAKGANRGEAIELIKSIEVNPDKASYDRIRDLDCRVRTLRYRPAFGISPYNSPSGFYVVDVQDSNQGLQAILRGQGKIRDVLLAFVKYVLRVVYEAEFCEHSLSWYKACILFKNEKIGDMFYVGDGHVLKIRLKKWHKRLTITFRRIENWTIQIRISTNRHDLKDGILPLLQRLKENYERLIRRS